MNLEIKCVVTDKETEEIVFIVTAPIEKTPKGNWKMKFIGLTDALESYELKKK